MGRSLKGVDVDVAQTFGLFCDVGIPLLMQRFSGYTKVLQAANVATEQSFTQVEQAHIQTDHALIGALMARSWGVSQTVCLAIRLHHDYAVFQDPNVPDAVARLVAMGLIAEAAIQNSSSRGGTSHRARWLTTISLANSSMTWRADSGKCSSTSTTPRGPWARQLPTTVANSGAMLAARASHICIGGANSRARWASTLAKRSVPTRRWCTAFLRATCSGNESETDKADSAAVTRILSFGSAANLNIHLCCLMLSGVQRCGEIGAPVLVTARAPTDEARRSPQRIEQPC